MNEDVAVLVDHLGAQRADLLRHQRAVNLIRIGDAGGMILQRVLIQQLCAGTVAEHQSVRRRSVMVGGRESLVMHAARAAGRQNHAFRADDEELQCLHVEQNRAGCISLVILQNLDRGRELKNRDAAVQHFVPQGPHDLGAGVVLAGVHSLPGRAAAVRRDHVAVLVLVELAAEFVQPEDVLRRLGDELRDELLLRHEMAAAVSVEEMLLRRIVRLVGRLNAALRHHGVRVTGAELRRDQDLRPRLVGLDGRRAAGSASADDEHVRVISRFREVHLAGVYARVSFQHRSQLVRRLLALVRPHLQFLEGILVVIRMELGKERVLLLRGHPSRLRRRVGRTFLSDFFDRFLIAFWIHVLSSVAYASMSRLLYISRISASDLFIYASIASLKLPS